MLARLANGKLSAQDVIIRNISKRGLGVATQGSFPRVGDSLSIKLPTGPTISGVVRWAEPAALHSVRLLPWAELYSNLEENAGLRPQRQAGAEGVEAVAHCRTRSNLRSK
ncbi:MAG: hypothetical protein NVS3B5_14270 [Sphingomicrobium sp.]